jgi:hypothetical protein
MEYLVVKSDLQLISSCKPKLEIKVFILVCPFQGL